MNALMKVLLLYGCSLIWPGLSTAAQKLSHPDGQPGPNCQLLLSPLVRLACYERWASHHWPQPEVGVSAYRLLNDAVPPLTLATGPAASSDVSPDAPTFVQTMTPGRITLSQHSHGATLRISCQQQITHLNIQLETPWPIATPSPELWLDQIPQSARWFIRQQGQVLESGRGLPAIAQLKNWLTAQQLRITIPQEHQGQQGQEMRFTLRGLSEAIKPLRQECHW
jgi:type VI secretion system VasI family protein